MLHQARLALNGQIPPFMKEAYLRFRELNAASRALPDFLLIGAQKSGTTSLFNYLCLHPKIVGSVPKEIFYFCSHTEKSERWYRRHFPRLNQVQREGLLCGEATPTSLYSARAAERAASLVPHAKIIAILREPAARAVSHYHHRLRTGRESRSIDEVFSSDQIQKWKEDTLSEFDSKYFDWSDYATGLKTWLRHYPREQLLVLEAERMFTCPQAIVDQVCPFLAIETYTLPTTQAFNAGTSKAVKAKTFKALQNVFSAQNSELRGLGFEMNWMYKKIGSRTENLIKTIYASESTVLVHTTKGQTT